MVVFYSLFVLILGPNNVSLPFCQSSRIGKLIKYSQKSVLYLGDTANSRGEQIMRHDHIQYMLLETLNTDDKKSCLFLPYYTCRIYLKILNIIFNMVPNAEEFRKEKGIMHLQCIQKLFPAFKLINRY